MFIKNRKHIIVSGLPRSGTSLMMQMLEAGGITILTDGERQADENNPKGYYEYEAVKEMHTGNTSWVKQGRGKALKVVSHQLEYLPRSYPYQIIFMRRHLDEIVRSQQKMMERDGVMPKSFSKEKLLAEYEMHLLHTLRWLDKQSNIEYATFYHHHILANPRQQAQRLANFLRQSMPIESMVQVIEPKLYRSKKH